MQDIHISLPYALLTFLHSSVYRKIGLDISVTFKYLQSDCSPITGTGPIFTGHVDLGMLMRSCCATILGTMSTPALCAALLHRHFNKDPSICISTLWVDTELNPGFLQYAAPDAFTMWSIHDVLSKADAPHVVNDSTPDGTPVTMFAPDGRPLAHGVVTLDCPATFCGFNVMKTRMVMVVKQVLVPSYLISPQLVESCVPTLLSTFGPTPFCVLCLILHL